MAGDGGSETERYDLVGRDRVRFTLSRRGLARATIEWFRASSVAGELPALALGELGTLPDKELAELTPAIVPGCGISVLEGAVWGLPPGSETPVRLLATTRSGLRAFNAMDGRTNIREIARLVAAETGWPHDRAFAFARGLFLHLVGLRVCTPTECE
jgi:hypothetical protein